MASLKLENVSKIYQPGSYNEIKALSEVSLQIQEGEFVVIVGNNGSGKSTLIKLIEGSILTSSGKILVDDHDVTNSPEYRRKSYISIVPQNPLLSLAPNLTVEENFALALLKNRRAGFLFALTKKIKLTIEDYLMQAGFDGLMAKMTCLVGELSGGQKQAVSLLMALILKPKILLLDEHTASLDPNNVEKINNYTESLIKHTRITTIMVSHRIKDALELGTRLIVLKNGKVLYDVTAKEKDELTEQQIISSYIEVTR